MEMSRRSLVAATSAVVAGCLGRGDEAEADVSVSTPVFTENATTRRGEYDERGNSTYVPEDDVHVYFESEDDRAGASLGHFLRVVDPDGETVLEEEYGHADNFVSEVITVPEDAIGGEYTVEVGAFDGSTGVSDTATATFVVDRGATVGRAGTEFKVSEAVFTRDEPGGAGEYDEREDTVYAPEEVVWLYFDVDGLRYEETDIYVQPRLRQSLTVTSSDGEEVLDESFVFDTRYAPETDMSTFFVSNDIDTSGMDEGEYTVEAVFGDELGDEDETVEREARFVVSAPDDEDEDNDGSDTEDGSYGSDAE